MNNNIAWIRIIACCIWLTCGILSRSFIGGLSALASSMFLLAGLLENKDILFKKRVDKRKQTRYYQ